jgi:hypothetical protein
MPLASSSRGPFLLAQGTERRALFLQGAAYQSLHNISPHPVLVVLTLWCQYFSPLFHVPVLCGHKDTAALNFSSVKLTSQTGASQDELWYRTLSRPPSQYRHFSAKYTAFAARLWHSHKRRLPDRTLCSPKTQLICCIITTPVHGPGSSTTHHGYHGGYNPRTSAHLFIP